MQLAVVCRPCLWVRTVALSSAFLLFATVAQAGDREDALRLRAAALEAEGQCEEAIALARQAYVDGRYDARIGLVAGRCEVRLKRYPQALATLDEAKALPPQMAEIDLYRGIALYHLDDLEAARNALGSVGDALGENPLLDLYTGMLKLQEEQAREAALLLERARRADARAVEPVASYYAFLAWRSLGEDARAEAALERVREIDPDGPWVAEAERILSRRHLRSRPDVWASLRAGIEYDTNVVLRGSGVALPGDISDDSDWRGVWAADGGIELLRTEVWSAGFLAAYTGSAHIELSDFNYQFPTASAWIDRELGSDTTARARYDFGYAWVDKESFVMTHDWTASVHHRWEEAGRTSLAVVPFLRDYKYELVAPPGADPENFEEIRDALDRSGVGVDVALEHRYGTGLGDLEVRGGYIYTHYSSDGIEYDFDGHGFALGLNSSLPFDDDESRAEVVVDAWAGYTYRPYERASIYQSSAGRRKDHILEVGAALERPITDRTSLLFKYTFVDNRSNVDAYDYDRHIVGGYITVNLW
jgi:tetratricopeptide (TPR) repeat protein